MKAPYGFPLSQIKNAATFAIDDVYNTYAIGGCDLSATTDLTAATLLIRKPNDKTVYVLQQYFLPQARVEHLEEKNTNEAPYRIWAERGLLTICEGSRRKLLRRNGVVCANARRA